MLCHIDLFEQFDGFYNRRLASKKVCFRNIVSFRQNYWTGNDSLDHRNTSLVLAGHEFVWHDMMWHDRIHPTSRDGQYSMSPPMIVMRWQVDDRIDMQYVGTILLHYCIATFFRHFYQFHWIYIPYIGYMKVPLLYLSLNQPFRQSQDIADNCETFYGLLSGSRPKWFIGGMISATRVTWVSITILSTSSINSINWDNQRNADWKF